MQTFLPYPDFVRSAEVLDYRRLGKQRLEVIQLIKESWPYHPVTKMWRKHKYQLAEYGKEICLEWIVRGYKDNCLVVILELQEQYEDTGLPPWFGDKAFHLAHQSNLVRKKPEFYGPMFPGVPDNIPYIYPI